MFLAEKLLKPPSGAAADSYFYDVSLLLTGDGTNGAQNNTFLDSSTNNFTITRNGNTTQGSFSPYGSLWSNYFDGGANYLSASSSASPSGTEDFCVELWYNPGIKPTNYPTIFAENTTYSYTTSLQIYDRHDAYPTKFSVYGCGINGIASTTTVTAGTWYHIAVTRNLNGGVYTLRLFINGVLEASQTGASSSLSANACYIGRADTASLALTYINAYVSNFRIVRGASVYTSNFTPSTVPLTAISGTSLLTCQSNRFIDNSSNAYAITVTGSPSVQRFSPFNPTSAYSTSVIGGSGYFDGNGDYLSVATNSALSISGNVDASIEFWVYPTTSGVVVNKSGVNGSSYANYIVQVNSNASITFSVGNSGSPGSNQNTLSTSPSTIIFNAWNHVVCTKNYVGGGSVNVYRVMINGVLSNNNTQANPSDGTPTALTIGHQSSGSSDYLTGYLTDLRIFNTSIPAAYQTSSQTNGTVIFTPPTTPIVASTSSILTSYINAGIYDNAMMNDLETVGNAQISTSVKKYGTGSIAMTSTGDYCKSGQPSIVDDINGGDFTIEFWVNFTSLAADRALVSKYGNSAETTGNYGYVIQWVQSSSVLRLVLGNGSSDLLYTWSWSPSTSTWYHVAITRSGTSGRAFINGTQIGTTSTLTTSDVASPNPIQIGKTHTVAQYLLGYIDDFRLTKGYARYTSNFTAPTAPLPLY